MDVQSKYQVTAQFVINRYRNILATKKIGFKIMEGPKNLNSLLCELSLFHLEDMHYPQTAKRAIRSEIYKSLNIEEPVEQ